MISKFGLLIFELNALEDSLGDILLGFVTVYKVFEDIGESDLMVITRCETRSVQDPGHVGQKKNERTCLVTII